MCLKPVTPIQHATRWLLAFVLCALPGSALAAVVEGDQATFNWSDAAGPVAGYHVYVTRNGNVPASPELAVTDSSATVTASVGDSIAVQVAAFDGQGNQGPVSAPSEQVVFAAAPPPPAPPSVVVDVNGDLSIADALAYAQAGEQVVVQVSGAPKHFFDTSLPEGHDPAEPWGLDQLVVGTPSLPATVRLVDAIGMAELQTPLSDLPAVTLYGLGNGPPCARDGGPGLVMHPGSRLVLGGMDLFVFDGQQCVLVNEQFSREQTNEIAWGAGTLVLHGDLEDDGVLDPEDNCLLVANPDQCDSDGDGFGSACDQDVDGDQVVSVGDLNDIYDASRQVSRNPIFDLNCNGAVDANDISAVLNSMNSVSGPSGLACAATATCASP
jgi:hypothetical protein